MIICLDIETMPIESMILNLSEPEIALGNLKDPEKIEAKKKEAKNRQIANMALNPYRGQICAISTLSLNGKGNSASLYGATKESDLIRVLLSEIIDNNIITFNGMTFDLPFIFTRAMLLDIPVKIPLSSYIKRYSYYPHCDVRMMLTQWDVHASGKLGLFTKMILGKEKPELDYNLFPQMIKEGKGPEIADNCLEHTKLTMELYQKVAPWFIPDEKQFKDLTGY